MMSKAPPKDRPQPLKAPVPKAKDKPSHGGPATKAEHAALKRIDKMVIKRMRKR